LLINEKESTVEQLFSGLTMMTGGIIFAVGLLLFAGLGCSCGPGERENPGAKLGRKLQPPRIHHKTASYRNIVAGFVDGFDRDHHDGSGQGRASGNPFVSEPSR
jgi:hypothetical protein